MSKRWLSWVRYIGGMRADASRCKRCPGHCVLWDWMKQPYGDRGWFKQCHRWVPNRTPRFKREREDNRPFGLPRYRGAGLS